MYLKGLPGKSLYFKKIEDNIIVYANIYGLCPKQIEGQPPDMVHMCGAIWWHGEIRNKLLYQETV